MKRKPKKKKKKTSVDDTDDEEDEDIVAVEKADVDLDEEGYITYQVPGVSSYFLFEIKHFITF